MPIPNTAGTATNQAINFPIEFAVDVDGEVFDVKVSSVGSKAIEVEKQKKQPRRYLPVPLPHPCRE